MAQFVRIGNYTINLDQINFVDWDFKEFNRRDAGVSVGGYQKLLLIRSTSPEYAELQEALRTYRNLPAGEG